MAGWTCQDNELNSWDGTISASRKLKSANLEISDKSILNWKDTGASPERGIIFTKDGVEQIYVGEVANTYTGFIMPAGTQKFLFGKTNDSLTNIDTVIVFEENSLYFAAPTNFQFQVGFGVTTLTIELGNMIFNNSGSSIDWNTTDTLYFHSAGGIEISITSGTVEIVNNFEHKGGRVGFYGVASVSQPAAYTQTYSTATRTHAAVTSAAVVDTNGTFGFLAAADRTAIITAINAIRTDLANLKQVVNSVIDDRQADGLAQ